MSNITDEDKRASAPLPPISRNGQNVRSPPQSSSNNNNNSNNDGINVAIGGNARVEKNVTTNFAVSKEIDASKADLLTQLKSTPTAPGGKINVGITGNAHVGDSFVADTLIF